MFLSLCDGNNKKKYDNSNMTEIKTTTHIIKLLNLVKFRMYVISVLEIGCLSESETQLRIVSDIWPVCNFGVIFSLSLSSLVTVPHKM